MVAVRKFSTAVFFVAVTDDEFKRVLKSCKLYNLWKRGFTLCDFSSNRIVNLASGQAQLQASNEGT